MAGKKNKTAKKKTAKKKTAKKKTAKKKTAKKKTAKKKTAKKKTAKKKTAKKKTAKKKTAKKKTAKKKTAKKKTAKKKTAAYWKAALGASVGESWTWGVPATRSGIRAAERLTGHAFPGELVEFLLAHDGLENDRGDSLVMTADEIATWTLEYRENYADFEGSEPDRMLMIGNWLGNGDLYACVMEPRARESLHEIVIFDHETGATEPLAADLAELLATRGDKAKLEVKAREESSSPTSSGPAMLPADYVEFTGGIEPGGYARVGAPPPVSFYDLEKARSNTGSVESVGYVEGVPDHVMLIGSGGGYRVFLDLTSDPPHYFLLTGTDWTRREDAGTTFSELREALGE